MRDIPREMDNEGQDGRVECSVANQKKDKRMSKPIEKKPKMRARGIRFSDKVWEKVEEQAHRFGVTPSDVVRSIVNDRYKKDLQK